MERALESSTTRQLGQVTDPERVGLAWIAADRAVMVRWSGEPILEHVDSHVATRRRAVGSVRRGPARPDGGGRVPGHGTKTKHGRDMRRFFTELAAGLEDLDVIEVIGRGITHERFADLLRRVAARRSEDTSVSTRALSKRPSDEQLKARLRRLVGAEAPETARGAVPARSN